VLRRWSCHQITVAAATPNRRAAARQLIPSSTAASARDRRSIVNKITGQISFIVLPRRWVVERFFAWINRNRRLAKDVEPTLKSAAAFLHAAAAMLMIRRLARPA
jgi:transposase